MIETDLKLLVSSTKVTDNTYQYKLVISAIKSYHNGPGYLLAENILADVTCPFTIFIDNSGTLYDFASKT